MVGRWARAASEAADAPTRRPEATPAADAVVGARISPDGAPTTLSPAAFLALQRAAGNAAVAPLLPGAQRVSGDAAPGALQRQEQKTPPQGQEKAPAAEGDPLAEHIARGDWHGGAWALSRLEPAALRARAATMSSSERQAIVEGARHGAGRWPIDTVIGAVDALDHRDAVIGSVRFFHWKRDWRQLGVHLAGLDDDDIRRWATRLGITREEMYVIIDEQPGKAQQERLSVAFFSKLGFLARIPRDLVGKDAGSLARAWLLKDDLVRPHAEAKWHGGATPSVHVVPEGKWADLYVERSRGRHDPELGRPRTEAEARQRAVLAHGFTTETDDIYLRAGDNTPGNLLHEAVHALAPDAFADLGKAIDEGTTEFFARRVARSAGKPPSRAYLAECAGVATLAELVGESVLAGAFFTGKTLGLKFAVDDRKGEGTFQEWRDAMGDEARRAGAPDVLRAGKPAPDAGK